MQVMAIDVRRKHSSSARKMERMKERAQGKIEDANGGVLALMWSNLAPLEDSETALRKMMFPFQTDWIIIVFSTWFQLQVLFF